MKDFFSNHFKGEQLQAALYAWIEHNNQDLIEQALVAPPSYIDWEDLIRFAVQQNNMTAFDALVLYSKNNLSDTTHSTHLQSAVWDSVVHNAERVWEQYFDWHPTYTTQQQWREALYIHTSKHNNLKMLQNLQANTCVSFDTWKQAALECIEKGHPEICLYLLDHPVEISSQDAAVDFVYALCFTNNNREQMFEVAFEYASLNDMIAIAPSRKEEIFGYYQIYLNKKSQQQRHILLDNIPPSPLISKRKI